MEITDKVSLQLNLLKNLSSLILFFSSLIMVMGSNLVNPVLPEIINNFGINEGKAGLVIFCFTFPTIFIAPVIGSLADMYGKKIFLCAGMFLYGIAGLMIGIVLIKNPKLLVVLSANLIRFFILFGFKIYLPILLVLKFDTKLVVDGFILGIEEILKSDTSW